MPFDIETGKLKAADKGPTYVGTIANYLMEQIKVDPTVVAICAGTPGGFGFNSEWRKAAGKQYIDVGIAEEHAIAMSSGIAKNGGKPVFNVYSTFLQRTYDQLVQDLCVNNNSAVIINHQASVYGMNDVTHLGFFDIPMLTSIPNLVYLAPTNNEELLAMTKYAVHQHEHPVAIRVPVGKFISTGVPDTTDYSILHKSEVTRHGEHIALLGLGNFYHLANQVADELAKDGIDATVVNPKFASDLDEELLESLKTNHSVVFTLEDGVVEGGWGQRVASFYGPSTMRVKNYGIAKEFHDRYDATELLQENGVSVDQIVSDVKALLS